MTKILLGIFVKGHRDVKDPDVRKAYGALSGVVGIVLNTMLFGVKLFVALYAGSVAIMADAFNNLQDSLSSFITIVGFKLSGKPPDKEHPFGHGRYEDVAGLVMAALILVLSYEFAVNSINAIINPSVLYYSPLVMLLLVFSMLVKLWMFVFNRHLGRAINAEVLKAVSIDSINDSIITLATLVSIAISAFFRLAVDGFVGLAITLFLFRSGIGIARSSLGNILGRAVDTDTAKAISTLVMSHEGIMGVHDLVVHSYGYGNKAATIHAELPMDMHLRQAHDIVDKAEGDVRDKLNIDLVIHIDPVDINDSRLMSIKRHVEGLLKQGGVASAHDFRLKETSYGTDIIFELAIPHAFPKKEREVLLSTLRDSIISNNSHIIINQIRINLEHGFINY